MKRENYSLIYIQGESAYTSAMHRWKGEKSRKPLLLIHGSIENASIFFSKSGKGLGPYLMDSGFDVFIPDLPGKGKSQPLASRNFDHSQSDAIHRDIPAYLAEIGKHYPNEAIALGGHSWGGVLLLAWYALHGKKEEVSGMVFFGSKRRVSAINWERIIGIDIFWNLMGRSMDVVFGYFPAKLFMKSADNVPKTFHRDGVKWIYQKKWMEKESGENISDRLKSKAKPPMLFIAGIKDTYLGNPKDVKLLIKESGAEGNDLMLLRKDEGYSLDYGHIDMLTSPKAINDHFPKIANWLHHC